MISGKLILFSAKRRLKYLPMKRGWAFFAMNVPCPGTVSIRPRLSRC
jgi:hypothetical protein